MIWIDINDQCGTYHFYTKKRKLKIIKFTYLNSLAYGWDERFTSNFWFLYIVYVTINNNAVAQSICWWNIETSWWNYNKRWRVVCWGLICPIEFCIGKILMWVHLLITLKSLINDHNLKSISPSRLKIKFLYLKTKSYKLRHEYMASPIYLETKQTPNLQFIDFW